VEGLEKEKNLFIDKGVLYPLLLKKSLEGLKQDDLWEGLSAYSYESILPQRRENAHALGLFSKGKTTAERCKRSQGKKMCVYKRDPQPPVPQGPFDCVRERGCSSTPRREKRSELLAEKERTPIKHGSYSFWEVVPHRLSVPEGKEENLVVDLRLTVQKKRRFTFPSKRKRPAFRVVLPLSVNREKIIPAECEPAPGKKKRISRGSEKSTD